MNINDFFKELVYLNDDFMPKQDFPSAIYDSKYTKKEDVIKSQLSTDDSNEMYLLYCCDEGIKHCIGIDQELDYINKLNNSKIAVPRSKRFNIEGAMREAFVLYDIFYKEQSSVYFDVKFIANLNVINSLNFIRKGVLNDFEYNLVLTAFENNPIKKDISLAQFNYFVKKYVQFRLKMNGISESHYLPLTTFNCKLKNELSKFCSVAVPEEVSLEEIMMNKLFNDLIVSNLKLI